MRGATETERQRRDRRKTEGQVKADTLSAVWGQGQKMGRLGGCSIVPGVPPSPYS